MKIEFMGDEEYVAQLKEKLPENIDDIMFRGLPEGTKITFECRGAFTWSPPTDLLIRVLGPPCSLADNSFYFSRFLRLEECHASHQSGHVVPSFQKKGIARHVNSNMFALYEHLKINNVLIGAGDVGSYAWARLGFVPHLQEWERVRSYIKKRLDVFVKDPNYPVPLSKAYVNFLKKCLNSDDPKMLWLVADQATESYGGLTLGQALTICADQITCASFPHDKIAKQKAGSCGWIGRFDMNDTDCRNRLQSYKMSGYKAMPKLRHGRTVKI